MSGYLIGIDAGTTNIKAVLFSMDGRQLAEASEKNEVLSPRTAWAEQNMNDLWDRTTACCRTLMEKTGIGKEAVAAIGLSAQGEGLWTVGADGKPARSAILWNDGRAAELVAELRKDTRLIDDLKLRIGSYIKPGSTLVQIKWLAENEPETYARVRTIFTCKDYLRYRMTGTVRWELTDASCSCLDMETRRYPADLFERLGIASALEKLPELMESTGCGGTLTPAAAEEMGLAPGTPVSGGMIDIVATAVGAGAVNTYSVCTILGTTGMNLMTVERYEPDLNYNGWECHMIRGNYVKGMGMMAAMPNQDWVLREIFGRRELTAEVFAETDPVMLSMKPGEGGLLYLPHIDPSGERAPFFDPGACAQLMGIKTSTTKQEILHAVIEGVCLGIRSCLEILPKGHPVFLSGGGAKSAVWPQILADCTGREVLICESTELAAKGAALSAAMMLGRYKTCGEAGSFFQIKRSVCPDAGKKRSYDALYAMYCSAQERAKEFWRMRSAYLKEAE